ncbi:MAG: hypothetical protein ACPGVT_13745 [Maricaulaceae bacterium]
MTSILKAALIASIFTGFATPSLAEDMSVPLLHDITLFTQAPAPETLNTNKDNTTASLPYGASIGIARIQSGQIITAPYQETPNWNALSRSGTFDLNYVTPGAYLNATPSYTESYTVSDNVLDEIRLAAVDSGLPYVLFYGTEGDAHWASFGGKALVETGLNIPQESLAWESADAKAMLVDSYTGDVLGAVTTNSLDMETLTQEVGAMITSLTDKSVSL